MSSSTDSPIVVGRVGRPHGLHGEVTVLLDTDDPSRFSPGARFMTDDDRALEVISATPYRDRGVVVGFAGVTDRSAAEALRGMVLTVAADDRRRLGDGEFWPDDLIGLEAVGPTGVVLGRVSGIELGVAQDRLVVTDAAGDEVLVPFVDAIVGDPEGGSIVIDPPEGLFS